MSSRSLTVLVNEAAGAAAGKRLAIEEAFSRANVRVRIVSARGPDIPAAAERAAAAGETLIAAGGDGTVSTVASVAVKNGSTFGVIPLGTLNHFAKDAGIPLDVDEAVAAIAAGHTRAVDAGAFDGRTFLNNLSLGFYPRIVREREIERSRGHSKWVAFGIALTMTWVRYRTVTVHLVVDGVPLVRRTPFVFIGNGEYNVEGLDLGRRKSLTSGRLWIYVAPECGRFEMLTLSLRAIAGLLGPDVELEIFSAVDVSIKTGRRQVGVAIDGELLNAPPPLGVKVRPGTLRIIVPR